jgi:hypothetical protein
VCGEFAEESSGKANRAVPLMEFFYSAFERIKILARLQTRNVKPNFEKKKKRKLETEIGKQTKLVS